MSVRISDIVAEPHLKDFNSNALEQILYGGRASFKSSRNALKIALRTLEEPCEVIVVRENYVDHRSTTFADLKWAYQKLGVTLLQKRHYPEGTNLYIKLPNGSHIHFKHMKDIDSLKGTRPHNPTLAIKIIWFYEITEMKSKYHVENAISGFVRGAKDWYWILYEFNPAPKLSHWTYDWIREMEGTSNVLSYKTNYNDAPVEQQEDFLGRIYLDRIEKLKRVDPEQYKSIYLGLPANLSGTVYKQFDEDRHVKDYNDELADITIGVDVGGADATVFNATGWLPGFKGLHVVDHWYHKNGITPQIMTINDYVDELIKFCRRIHKWWKRVIEVYIDPANLTFIQLVKERSYRPENQHIIVKELNKTSSDKRKSSVQERCDITELMFGADYLTIDPNAKELIKAFLEAEYNKQNERADDGRSNIDSLDAFEYSWLSEKKLIQDIILE